MDHNDFTNEVKHIYNGARHNLMGQVLVKY